MLDTFLGFAIVAVFFLIVGFAIRAIWVDRRGRRLAEPPFTSRGFEVLPPK
jgi:hypothetical protein